MAENNSRILVIEDNEDILLLFKAMLSLRNFQVMGIDNANDVESVAASFSPHAILLDMLLAGGQDGLTVCRSLKSAVATQKIPIIIVSAHPAAEKSYEAGADFFIAKPFEMKVLLETIEMALGLKTHGKQENS